MLPYEDLVVHLEIDPDCLDRALIRQPQLFLEASEKVASMIRFCDQAKQDLAVLEAKKDAAIREQLLEDNVKVTEKAITGKLNSDPDLIEKRNKLIEKKEELDRCVALKDAFIQRSYALKDLTALHIAGYFGTAQSRDPRVKTSLDGEQKKMRGEVRQASDAKVAKRRKLEG